MGSHSMDRAERGLNRGWGIWWGSRRRGWYKCLYAPLPIHLDIYAQRVSESVGVIGAARQSTAPSVSESVRWSAGTAVYAAV
jgi:hypothetical protein